MFLDPSWSDAAVWTLGGSELEVEGSLARPEGRSTEDWPFGTALAALEDLDGDGVGELVVGFPEFDADVLDEGGLFVYSGASQECLGVVAGTDGAPRLGEKVCDLGHGELGPRLGVLSGPNPVIVEIARLAD